MGKRVTVENLKDQIGAEYPRPFLYCRKCGAEYSANAGDYFMARPGHVFKCCKVNMLLVTAKRVLTEVN
jgi:hypothetical protein